MDFKYYMQRALAAPEEGDKIEYFNLKARVSGNVLVNAQRTIPTPVYVYEADITKFYNEYQKLKEECGYPLSFNTLMMRLLVEGLKVAPRLNAHLEYNHTASCGRLIVKKHIDVAMPIFMDGGITFWGDVKIIFQTIGKVLKRSDTVREGTVSDMDFGDWLLEKGEVDQETYDAKQAEAKEWLAHRHN